jgi:steroid delta-isomerase-like uncharacterized protein
MQNPMLTADKHIALTVRHFREVLEGRNPAAVADIYTPDVMVHGPMGMMRGQAAIGEWAGNLREAFSDLQFDVDYSIADGDRVVCHFSAQGRNSGSYLTAAPTGANMTIAGVLVFRIDDGKIAEIESMYNARTVEIDLGGPAPHIRGL